MEIRKRKMKGKLILGIMILGAVSMSGMANVVYLNPFIQSDTRNSAARKRYADINCKPIRPDDPTEDGLDHPNDSLPLIDEGDDITTAEGLSNYYGINISDIRGILPDWIPSTDKKLFEAYTSLFRQTTPIFFGPYGLDQTSGHHLGTFIAENNIIITWEDKNIVDCGPNGMACVDRNNPDPRMASTIYIVDIGYSPINIADIYAGRIAHEAFHLTFPYGTENSKLEEMDACRIGSIITGSNTLDGDKSPDYSAEAISKWVAGYCSNIFGYCSYENLPLYPTPAVNALITHFKEE